MKTLAEKPKANIETLFYENFSNNNAGWEIVNNDTEAAVITENGYEIKNTDLDEWKRYTLFPNMDSKKNIRMRCTLEIIPGLSIGQIGIMWGFNEKHHQLNRFCISTSGSGCTIMHFEKNHRPVFYRFYDPFFSIGNTKEVAFEIREINNYFFFRINKQLVYIGHTSHFADLGSGFGFYVDPGVAASVKKIKIDRAISNKVFSLN